MSHRTSNRSPRPGEPVSTPEVLRRSLLGVGWMALFFVWFFSFDLPNNPSWTRLSIWSHLPLQLLEVVDPVELPNELPWSWGFLFQRIPLLGVATLIWAGALALGRLVLRGFGRGLFDRRESVFFGMALGLAGLSLIMLGLGLSGGLNPWGLRMLLAGLVLAELTLTCRGQGIATPEPAESGSLGWGRVWLPVLGLFVVCLLLGAMSPQTDFDVLEYHLGGPKEWYLQGQITRLSHNVYTSFPFLTEMLLLCGMVVHGDWQTGALAGQAVIAGFAPLTAWGLYATGRRWFSARAGMLAALVWITIPWTYRISIIAYAEGGLSCYLFAAHAVALRLLWTAAPSSESPHSPWTGTESLRISLIGGLLAGSAMACKYTGLVSVIVPVGVMLFVSTWRQEHARARRDVLRSLAVFALGCAVTIGPWLIKNTLETGNPVFPLAYRLFGGEGRDEKMDEQWRRGHSRHYSSLVERAADLPVKLRDVVADNDWHSPLSFGLAPVALLACWRRRVWGIWGLIGWQFLQWFLFTHQLDRFYVPMFPLVALLAGIGAAWLVQSPLRHAASMLIVIGVVYNAGLMANQRVAGFNAGRLDLAAAHQAVISPPIRYLNEEFAAGRLPAGMKVLCVGEAALFHARFPYVYNTVFDRSRFVEWFADPTGQELQSGAAIRAQLSNAGITHILVNWGEILRYREPGSYGYPDLAKPSTFVRLQETGLLGPAWPLPESITLRRIDGAALNRLRTWGPELLVPLEQETAYRYFQLFPVRHN